MKHIKIILLSTIISFTLTSYNSAYARDCTNPKGFHNKMVCKLQGNSVKADNEVKQEGETWTKLKKFLGKKNNEVTGN